MKLTFSASVLLALFAFSSSVEAWKPPHGCAKVCVPTPWYSTYKCPKYCKSEKCFDKHWQKGVKCLPTPAPSPSPTPLPKGCAKVCVFYPWKYGYKCPHYCMEKPCYKHHQKKGFKCVPTPAPTPSPSPLPKGCAKACVPTPWIYKYSCPYYCMEKPCHKYHKKGIKCVPTPPPTPSPSPLPKGCASVCVPTPWLYKYSCPHYCVEKPCYKHHKSGIKCLPKPTPSATPSPSPKPKPACDDKCVIYGKWKVRKSCNPHLCKVVKCSKWHLEGLQCVKKPHHIVHKPKPVCANKCVSAHALDKEGCDELKCQVKYCKTKHYGQTYVKCAPIEMY